MKTRCKSVSIPNPNDEAMLYVIQNVDPPWLEEVFINDEIGRGVFLTCERKKDSFLAEYCGELVTAVEGQRRENLSMDESVYRYFMNHNGLSWCIDATAEPTSGSRLGRLINHSKKYCARSQLLDVNGVPHLCFFATKDLQPGEQVLYDYGITIPFKDLITRSLTKSCVVTKHLKQQGSFQLHGLRESAMCADLQLKCSQKELSVAIEDTSNNDILMKIKIIPDHPPELVSCEFEPPLVAETIASTTAHEDLNIVITTLSYPVQSTELSSFNELEPPPVTETVDSLPVHEDLHSVMTTLSSNQSYQDQSTELCSFNESERTLSAETVKALAANADLNAVMSTLAYPVQSTELCSFNQSEPLLVAETVTSPLSEVDVNAVLTIKTFPVQQTELCSFNQSEHSLVTETVYAPAAYADLNAVTTTLASPVQQTELCSFNELEPPPVTETVDSIPVHEDLHSAMTTLSLNQSYQDQSTELCSFNESERTLATETVLVLAANADLNAVMSTLAYPVQSTELCSFNQSEPPLVAETVTSPLAEVDLNAVLIIKTFPVQQTELAVSINCAVSINQNTHLSLKQYMRLQLMWISTL